MRWLVCALIAGCGQPAFPAAAPGLRFAPSTIREFAKTSRRVAVTFELAPEGTNGTQLVFGFLAAAQASGARYISDLAIVLELERDGQRVSCQARPDAPQPTVTHPSWRATEVDADVDDLELACRDQATQVVVHGELGKPVTESYAGVHWVPNCTPTKVHRRVHRAEPLLAARFTPPDWKQIEAKFSDHSITDGPVLCRVIANDERRGNRIEAMLHYVHDLEWSDLPAQFRDGELTPRP